MKHIISIILAFSFSLAITAGDASDLQSFIRIGLEQNFQIRMVRNEQMITDNNYSPGNAGLLPTVDLNASYSGANSNGTQYPQDGSAAISNNGASSQTLTAGVNLNWTVFDGFQMQSTYSKLREYKEIGALQTRLNIENYIADLAAEYYNFIRQSIRLENLNSTLKLSRERLRIVEARYNIGNLSRLDLQQARVDFNTDSSRLIQQHEVLYSSRIKINQMMAMDDVEQPLIISDTIIRFDALLEKEQMWQNTLSNNVYLLLGDREKSVRALELQAARSANYPYLRVNAGYGYTENFYNYGTNNRQNNLGLNYGISLGYNIFDGFNRSRKQKNARLQLNNQELMLEELKLSLKSEFSNLWMAYLNNMNLTSLEKENLTHAMEYYEIAMERYMLGDLSGLELREAQNNLLEAEERLLQAQYVTKLCEVSLLEISGSIQQYL